MQQHNNTEIWIGRVLFNSRWLLAPFYLGMVGALVILMVAFFAELLHAIPGVMNLDKVNSEQVILSALEMIDLSLAGNLVVIVIFSGYENFVARIATAGNEDRPDWMGKLDFSGLKMKLIGSIVAISAIQLLRIFMYLAEGHTLMEPERIRWMTGLHLTFVISGLAFAATDWIRSRVVKDGAH